MEFSEQNTFSLGDTIHPSVSERYYNQKYRIDIKKQPGYDQCVLSHSNRVCLVTMAASHDLITSGRIPKQIDFKIDDKTDRTANKVSGKGKKGAQWLTENSPLCRVTCTDGTEYILYSCLRGHLMEINERLYKNPTLLIEKPETDGYLAIVMPKLVDFKSQIDKLLSIEQYKTNIGQRKDNLTKDTETANEIDNTNDVT
ncbi:unnamed protein product [Owenia fusiformis]|uniref:Protein Abitram n=2 Tax=Owenia fusiformis TaxID=6347 RepID=A0A8J1UKJ9_OWEFU|nr:unnamed protein product [Owenia fusiformis]